MKTIVILALFAANSMFAAGIVLSPYNSSNMVIQHSAPLPFRGTGPAGSLITLDFNREGVHYVKTAVIDSGGRFTVILPALAATSSPCSATLTTSPSSSTVQLNNILIGDVWFVGGQSNMEKKVDYMLDASTTISQANNYPNIRAFRAVYNSLFSPASELRSSNAPWCVCNSTNISGVSAVAYIFAKKIHQETGLPIGLMQAYMGATEIETWISPDRIANDPGLQMVRDRLATSDRNDPDYSQFYPSVNYNGMVNPLTFYPVKGFLFYQGEGNVKRASEYKVLLEALIQDWRTKWGLGNLPFFYVQLPNIGIATNLNYEPMTNYSKTWQMLREQQLLVSRNSAMANIGMAVTIETNEEHLNPDITIRAHPRNKKPVGERLANLALKEQYGKDIVARGPEIQSSRISGNKIILEMKNTGSGLKIRDGATTLKGFAVAGSDGKYYEAAAQITSSTSISINSPAVASPRSAAYGWSRDPDCTLDNSANLPASPFRVTPPSN